MTRRAIVIWFMFIPVAVLNGLVRESLFKRHLSDLRAHQLSSVSGSATFLGVAYVMLRDEAREASVACLLRTGAAWLGGTVLFEFGAGHYLVGNPWAKLLRDYDLRAGRVWTAVLSVIFLAPLLVKHLARATSGRRPEAD